MTYFVLCLLVLLSCSFSAFSQTATSELKTVELTSPLKSVNTDAKRVKNGRSVRRVNADLEKYCFNFITESTGCGKVSDIYYGTLRVNNAWDWFTVSGEGSRNKIKSLGKKNWTDNFKVPVVEPYARLKEGERRMVVVDASGSDGADGTPGKNADGTLNYDSNVYYKEMPPVGSFESREKTKSNYKPFERAVKGNMYVMRVLDEKNDFYVLFRVDELERGTRCKISWKRIEAPKQS